MSNISKPHSGDRSLLPKVGRVRHNEQIRKSALGEPCKDCGHSDLAHDDRYGVSECLVHNCMKCRDTSWIRLVDLKARLKATWPSLTEALFKLRETVVVALDPEDHECVKKEHVKLVRKHLRRRPAFYLTPRDNR